MTARTAQRFLATELDAWQAMTHPRPRFCIDSVVNPGGHAHEGRPFFVDAFLNNFSWRRDIVLQVNQFYIVWLSDVTSPGFWYSLQDGTTASIEVGDKARNCTVRSGDDSVSWV